MSDPYDEDETPTLRPPPPSGIAPRGGSGSGFRPAARVPSLEELFDDVTPTCIPEPETIPGVPRAPRPLAQGTRR